MFEQAFRNIDDIHRKDAEGISAADVARQGGQVPLLTALGLA